MYHSVQQNFSRAATLYDQHAQLQQEVLARLVTDALTQLPPHATLLDIGAGTGQFARMTLPLRPDWRVLSLDFAFGMCREASVCSVAIQGDAMRLPIATASVDAVVSSLCIQWVPELQATFAEIARVLKPGGTAFIATLTYGTLQELRDAADVAGVPLTLLMMREASEYNRAGERAGMRAISHVPLPQTRFYPHVGALLRSMRMIGAGGNSGVATRGMMGAQRWKNLLAHYESMRTVPGIPATWEVLHQQWEKPE